MATLIVPIADISQNALPGAAVLARLCDLEGRPIQGFTTIGGFLVEPQLEYADESGIATIELVPNAEILQDNTYYSIRVAHYPPVIIEKTAASQDLLGAIVASPAALGPAAVLDSLGDVETDGGDPNDYLKLGVDGIWRPSPFSGTGIDADTLDGMDSTAFATPANITSALNSHVAATDPHSDRAYTDTSLTAHVVASDPHGDRAFATSGDAATLTAAQTSAGTLYVPLTGGTIVGNLVVEKSGGTAAMRMRTTAASSQNIEGCGQDLWVSVWSGAGFTGTQRFYLRMRFDANELYLPAVVNFTTNLTTALHFINSTTGTVGFGFKNSHTNVRICGKGSVAGPPTANAWVVGDTIQDANGVWWLCVTAGTPGVWVSGNSTLPSTTTAGTSYTIVSADLGTVRETTSASAVNVTVPTMPAGSVTELCQYGAGQITLVADTGITLRSPFGLKSAAQYASISLRWRTATEVIVSGATVA